MKVVIIPLVFSVMNLKRAHRVFDVMQLRISPLLAQASQIDARHNHLYESKAWSLPSHYSDLLSDIQPARLPQLLQNLSGKKQRNKLLWVNMLLWAVGAARYLTCASEQGLCVCFSGKLRCQNRERACRNSCSILNDVTGNKEKDVCVSPRWRVPQIWMAASLLDIKSNKSIFFISRHSASFLKYVTYTNTDP